LFHGKRRTAGNLKAAQDAYTAKLIGYLPPGPLSDEIKAKKPAAYWTLARFIRLFLTAKRRRNLMQRLTGTDRNAEAFRRYNRYLMLPLSQKGQDVTA